MGNGLTCSSSSLLAAAAGSGLKAATATVVYSPDAAPASHVGRYSSISLLLPFPFFEGGWSRKPLQKGPHVG